MMRQRWTAPVGATLVAAAALACAGAVYREFTSPVAGDVLPAAYALALALGICGFFGLLAVAILLSSRYTPAAARDPLWAIFAACVVAALLGLPVVTGASFTPWSWPSFGTALAFSVVVNGAWARFLMVLIEGAAGGGSHTS